MTVHTYLIEGYHHQGAFTRLVDAYKFARKHDINNTCFWTRHTNSAGYTTRHQGFKTACEVRQLQAKNRTNTND